MGRVDKGWTQGSETHAGYETMPLPGRYHNQRKDDRLSS
jgi:hypothetical protein